VFKTNLEMSIFDTLSFVQKCLKSENVLLNFVSRHAVFFSRMNSGMGRNVQFYCERFGMRLHDSVLLARERKMVVDDGSASKHG